MTNEEIKSHTKLSKKLNRRGLCSNDWGILITLRTKILINRGEKPEDWDIDSFRLTKKITYRK